MAISDTDIKKLWGRAAARCAYPGCNTDCTPFLSSKDPTVLGEMAHIIARSPRGPRGQPDGGPDTYENLILLCPTHHRAVDKAPNGTFPVVMLQQWKLDHEAVVSLTLAGARLPDKEAWCREVNHLLIENHAIWETYGPESAEAKSNPISSAAKVWALRKVAKLVPNNRHIVNLIDANKGLLSAGEYALCRRFVEHAEGFEANCYSPLEGVPRFPKEFGEMVQQHVKT
jgi:hypothetical protein